LITNFNIGSKVVTNCGFMEGQLGQGQVK